MKTPVPILDPIFEEPEDGAGMTAGMVTLSPEEAKVIVEEMGFERQRDADSTHIGMLADMMMNDEWAEGSQLSFAINESGIPKLVDGQHRLLAAAAAQWEGMWNVRVLRGSVQGARPLYALLDGYQKKRPPSVIGRSLGFIGLSDRMQGVVILAARYQNQWRVEYTNPGDPPIAYPPIRDNIARVQERLPAFREADALLGAGAGSAPAKRKLLGAMPLAVVVETLAGKLAVEAREFWTAVSTYGDGVAGELRDGLVEGKVPAKAGHFFNPRLAASAWNQRGNGNLKREYKKDITVEGTTLEIPA